MQIKPWLKNYSLPLCAILFTAMAWTLAQFIPATARMDRWQRAAAELTPDAPTAEVCAVVSVHFSVRLTAQDVAVWKRLLQQGSTPEDALQAVVTYARGRIE